MGINTDFDINSYSSASPQLKDALESMLDQNLISRYVVHLAVLTAAAQTYRRIHLLLICSITD